MRVLSLALLLATLQVGSDAFQLVPSPPLLFAGRRSTMPRFAHRHVPNLDEFEFVLREGSAPAPAPTQRRRIAIPGLPNEQQRAIQLTSSAILPESLESATSDDAQQDTATSATEEADPYDDVFAEQLSKIQEYEEQQQQKGFDLQDYLKNSDLGDLVVTLAIPAIVLTVVGRWASSRAYVFFEARAEEKLDGFANEMLYHDGDFEEMKLCHGDYRRRLAWLGPKRNDAMLKRYLEKYAKKKTVSPQAISSMSYALSLFKLSEEKAAQTLVSLCKQMGTDKISSVGKLLFFGSRILKSPEGKRALEPIKTLIKSTYRDEDMAETLVETSQQAIGEAAYRAAVQDGGKNQKALTIGWEVLGLDKETAMRIFNEEAEEGFVTYREAMYSGQTTKYDKHGNALDKEGNLVDPEAAAKQEEEEEESGASGNVFECENCGYTLFIAQGRDFKFYGDDFKCPECGAPKEKFKARDLEE